MEGGGRGHQIRALSNLWSLKIQPRVILFSSNCRVRRKRDWLWLFTARKKHKRPAISCHLPKKNQMQGNKRVMGNFNLNKWMHLCCALALTLVSKLTHSCVLWCISWPCPIAPLPQSISPSSFWSVVHLGPFCFSHRDGFSWKPQEFGNLGVNTSLLMLGVEKSADLMLHSGRAARVGYW